MPKVILKNKRPVKGKKTKKPMTFEQGMRIFKRQCEKAGILQEIKQREYYEKPTTKRKRKKAAAIKREQKQQKQNNYLGRYKRFY